MSSLNQNIPLTQKGPRSTQELLCHSVSRANKHLMSAEADFSQQRPEGPESNLSWLFQDLEARTSPPRMEILGTR